MEHVKYLQLYLDRIVYNHGTILQWVHLGAREPDGNSFQRVQIRTRLVTRQSYMHTIYHPTVLPTVDDSKHFQNECWQISSFLDSAAWIIAASQLYFVT